MGNAVSSPVSLGLAFSLSRAGASEDTGAVLDEIFGFPKVDLHGAANAVDLMLAGASVEPTPFSRPREPNLAFPNPGGQVAWLLSCLTWESHGDL